VSDYLRRSDPSAELTGIIGQVRRRWRLKLALRGALAVLGLGLIVLLLSAWGLEAWRFTAGSIVAFRILLTITLAALLGWFLVRPLMRRVTDDQVALYLEEQEPSLQAEIVSAMDALRAGTNTAYSEALVRRLVESAVEKCHTIQDGRSVEAPAVRRYAGLIAATAVVALLVFSFGPSFFRHALSALLVISRGVEAAAPYRIEVTPGSVTVPRGANQTVMATLSGFDADEATLMVRTSPDAPFDRLPLIRGRGARVRGHPVRSRRPRGLLRRGGGRALAGVHADGRGPALRPAARTRLPLPGLHRPRAADRRARR
jgi:hypothetical protein